MTKTLFKLSLALFLIVVGCDPVEYHFYQNGRNDEIVSVDLISYISTAESLIVTESEDEILDFEEDNMEIQASLDPSQLEDFIDDFIQLGFFVGFPFAITQNGVGIRINYDNGDFIVITYCFVDGEFYGGDAMQYHHDGTFLHHYGGLSWTQSFIDLINVHFDTDYELEE